MRENVKKLMSLVSQKADVLLIISEVNRRYVTNFPSSDGFVLVKPNEVIYITDFRYFESAKIKQQQGIIDKEIRLVLQERKVYDQIKSLISDCKRIMFEDNYVCCEMFSKLTGIFKGFEFFSGSETLNSCRKSKTKEELEYIIKAQSITDKAFEYMLTFLSDNVGKDGFTERQAQLDLDYFMLTHGADGLAFDTICVSGHKSSLPHGVPENIPISKGFLTMDFGARFNGYCSDMTRTVCIGKPDDEMVKVYNTVLNAQQAAFPVIHADVLGNKVDFAARDVINTAGYVGTFGHSTGHSLGLDIHEAPHFSPNENVPVPEGAVVSVEPGIYIAGKYGVRIEDIVCVTKDGCIDLTNSKKELVII